MVFEVPDIDSGDTQSGVREDTATKARWSGYSASARQSPKPEDLSPVRPRREHPDDGNIQRTQERCGRSWKAEGAEPDPGGRAKDQDEGQE